MSINYAETYQTISNTHKTINAADFIDRLKTRKPTYELTPADWNEVVNFYVDIDDSRVHDEARLQDITDCVKDLIWDTFGSDIELSILTAHGKDKSSWHIHSNDIRGRKCDWKQYIIQMNKLIKTEHAILDLPLFDENVYSPNRYMRCFGTAKNGARPFALLEGSIENTIITLEKPGARIVAQLEKPEAEVHAHSFEGVPISDDIKTNMMQMFIDSGVLDTHACGDYTKWITPAFAIYNTFGEGAVGFDFFKKYSQRDTKRKPTEFDLFEKWANLRCTEKKRPLSFGTICHIAKTENPTIYQRIKEQTRPIVSDIDEHLLISGTEVDVAKYIINKWGKTITWCNKSIYTFQKLLWNEDENSAYLDQIIENACTAIKSSIFNNITKKNRLDESTNADEIKALNKIIDKLNKTQEKLGSTRTRDNVMKQIGRKRTEPDFVKSLNRQEFVLPLKDGKQIDIRTLEITQRSEDSKFTYECGANYIDDLSPEAEQEIDKYFDEMFITKDTNVPDIATKQCFVDIIKSCCGGVPLRYIYFLIGEGKNGKSLILNILSDIFKSAADTISKDVIINAKHNSQLTTHLEKLDKVRFGFTSELENTDELNQKVIKQITGGDKIDVRGLQKTNATIIPTANIFAITNELAKFKPDAATQDRLMVIPFYARFPKNPTFEKRMRSQEMLDAMFSYIMKRGNILAEFVESESMLDAKDEYIEQNNKSHLTDFIDTMCEVEQDLKVERDTFKHAYDEWLMSRGLKADRRDYNNFSRAMKRLKYNNIRSNHITYYIGLNIIPTTTCKVEYNTPNPWN